MDKFIHNFHKELSDWTHEQFQDQVYQMSTVVCISLLYGYINFVCGALCWLYTLYILTQAVFVHCCKYTYCYIHLNSYRVQ